MSKNLSSTKSKRLEEAAEKLADIVGEHLAALSSKKRKVIVTRAETRLTKKAKVAAGSDDVRPKRGEREQKVQIPLAAHSSR